MRTEINSRKPFVRSYRDEGFSLVELMVAVGIMGSLSVMAIPAYGRYQVKAAQAEAKTTLASVHTSAELFFTENQHYFIKPSVGGNEIGDLGITLSGDAKYKFLGDTKGITKTGTGDLTAGDSKYCAALESKNKLAGCASQVDIWIMNNKKAMNNDKTALDPCAADVSLDGGKDC